MLRHFVGPISQGLGIFMVVAAALLLPYVIWQYRRFGRVGPRRALVNSTFVLYLICAWAVVLLPLPDPGSLRHPAPVNLVPFQWWFDMLAAVEAGDGGWRAWLLNPPLLVRVFNVALTVPFGVYLRRWYRRGLVFTTVAGLVLSLAFEFTQVTALWGLYPMPYRQFDVDDLIANTAGASLGWALAPLVVLLPTRHHADDLPVTGPASPARRLTALVVDGVCWALAYLAVLFAVVTLGAQLAYDPLVATTLVWALTFCLVFVLVPSLAAGATPGRALVGIAVRDAAGGGEVGWWRLLAREALLLWPLAVVPWLAGWAHDAFPDRLGWTLAAAVLPPAGWLVLLGVVALLRRDRRSLPDLLVGTRVLSG